jgi:O-succinylbenzoic acid--CoA ligase
MLPDWLHQRASLSPDRLALVVGDLRWSFRELDQQATQIAQRLTTLDVSAGDRVALLARNGAPFVTLVHALSRLSLVLVPLNTRLSPAELRWQLADVRARLLIYDEANAQSALAAAHDLPPLRLLHIAHLPNNLQPLTSDLPPLTSNFSPPTSHFPLPTSHLDALHTILYTSGTTGQPKGAMLIYGNHWWSAMGSALNLGLHADDRWLACLPLFHVGGLAILLRGVIYGNAVIVHQAFDPAAVNRAIDEEGVTLISVVSTMLQQMLAERGERSYPPTLRCALLGGGPAPRDLLEECARRGVPVAQTYGLTEAASQGATLAPEDALRKLGSAGKPLFPTALRIERDGVEASAGEVGEIVVRGPTVTPGYADRPEDTALALRDGWLHTGDLGYLDDEGYLYVLDRRDDLIISGGENVYPAEVEAVLRSHPAVEDAGVVGVPDERWGQVPAAFVVARAGVEVTEADLKSFCDARLARYKVPTYISLVPSLPRNASGKLLRRDLAENSK